MQITKADGSSFSMPAHAVNDLVATLPKPDGPPAPARPAVVAEEAGHDEAA